jgi:diaminohydroxyphosphoribosylaminopyrimidine deaminase/5-amino-6-(5-phosphoribosylamino)uracil reductase
MDGILCGIGTVLADDPLLTARPAGPRQPLRIVLDTSARLPIESRLVRSAREIPVLVATGPKAPADRLRALAAAGCEVWQAAAADPRDRLHEMLEELGSRRLTNVLVEGGPTVLGSLADASLVDEVWAFVAPTIIGGAASPSPVAGTGIATLASATAIEIEHTDHPGGDLFIRGVVRRG